MEQNEASHEKFMALDVKCYRLTRDNTAQQAEKWIETKGEGERGRERDAFETRNRVMGM